MFNKCLVSERTTVTVALSCMLTAMCTVPSRGTEGIPERNVNTLTHRCVSHSPAPSAGPGPGPVQHPSDGEVGLGRGKGNAVARQPQAWEPPPTPAAVLACSGTWASHKPPLAGKQVIDTLLQLPHGLCRDHAITVMLVPVHNRATW